MESLEISHVTLYLYDIDMLLEIAQGFAATPKATTSTCIKVSRVRIHVRHE